MSTCESVPNTCQIFTRLLLSCFFIILREIGLENVSPSIRFILGLFVNRLTAVDKYPGQDCENLQLPIQMVLSGKRISFSGFFISFLESTYNFKHFERKDIRPR